MLRTSCIKTWGCRGCSCSRAVWCRRAAFPASGSGGKVSSLCSLEGLTGGRDASQLCAVGRFHSCRRGAPHAPMQQGASPLQLRGQPWRLVGVLACCSPAVYAHLPGGFKARISWCLLSGMLATRPLSAAPSGLTPCNVHLRGQWHWPKGTDQRHRPKGTGIRVQRHMG